MDTMSDGDNSSGDASKNVGELVSSMKSLQPHWQTAQVQFANMPPPFLSKTYDMVDDPLTDSIVSWSPTNNSLVVWNTEDFASDLLPKYFKHNKFLSFVRQLSAYGFKKVRENQWEFAKEGFLKGQKHLLLTIPRKKQVRDVRQHGQQPLQQSQGQQDSSVFVEVGKFGLKEEVEQLKRDKNLLTQEIIRLREQQQATHGQVQRVLQHLHGMEQRQQEMMSFVNGLQSITEKETHITEEKKKWRLQHQNIIRQITEMDVHSSLEPRSDHDKLLTGDGSLPAGTLDCRSNLSIHEAMQSSDISSTSGLSASDPPAVISDMLSPQDANNVATPHLPDTTALDVESIVDMTSEKCMEADKGSDVFAHPNPLMNSLTLSDLTLDPETDPFPDDSLWDDSFWDDLGSEVVQVGIEDSKTA